MIKIDVQYQNATTITAVVLHLIANLIFNITGNNYLDFIQQIFISCLWIALHELNDNLKDRNSTAITWILNFNRIFLRQTNIYFE